MVPETGRSKVLVRTSYAYLAAGAAVIIIAAIAAVSFFGSAPNHPLGWGTSRNAAHGSHERESATRDHENALMPQQQSMRTVPTQNDGRNLTSTLPRGSRADSSVIGRPFALSASMQAELSKSEAFRPARDRLDQMARESRDTDWANAKETEIQALMEGRYSIRNIECRATICAVEVVRLAGDPFDVITFQQGLAKINLFGPEYLTNANEAGDDRDKLWVTLFTTLRE